MSEEPDPKRRKLEISQFVDDIAGVVDDKDEEMEGEEDDGFLDDDQDFEDSATREEVDEARRFYKEKLKESHVDRNQDFLRRLEDRYVQGKDDVDIDMDLEDESGYDAEGMRIRRQQRVRAFKDREKTYLIPTASDPKLFMVRCKAGKERLICLTLMQKYFDFKTQAKLKKKQPLMILSSFSIDTLPGYIYVEAFKEAHVLVALEGVDDVYTGSRQEGKGIVQSKAVKLVPMQQMIQVVDFAPRGVKVKKGTWVRVTRGLYKGDLAYVFAVNETRGEAMVKLIPRLGVRARGRRPEKKKFNTNDYSEREVSQRNDPHLGLKFTLYDGRRFFDGFLFKVVNFKSIATGGVKPTLEEMQLFGDIEDVGELVKLRQKINVGDVVRIFKGELVNLIGKVSSVNIHDGHCVLVPQHSLLVDPISISLDDIVKHLEVGDFVRVVAGKYEGEAGNIVDVRKDTIVVYSDMKMKEFEVFAADARKSSPLTVSKSFGGFSLYDCVRVDSQTCGLIVAVSNKEFKVKDSTDKVLTLQYQQIRGTLRKNNPLGLTNRDSKQKLISLNSRVDVMDGPYKGRSGVVKGGWKQRLFLHSREELEDAGIFVVHEKDVVTQGVAQTTRHTMSGGKVLAATGTQGIIRRRQRNHEKLYKTVKIIKGKYKGMIGIVKSVSGEKARIELHSKFKIVSVPLTLLKDVVSAQKSFTSTSFMSGNQYTRRPNTSAHTLFRPQTPGHRPNTSGNPYSVNPVTPGGTDMWNPNQPVTPRRVEEEIDTPRFTMNPATTSSILPNTTNPQTTGMINTGIPTPATTQGMHTSGLIPTPNMGTSTGYTPSMTGHMPATPGSGLGAIPTPQGAYTPGMFGQPPQVKSAMTPTQPPPPEEEEEETTTNQDSSPSHWAREYMVVHVAGEYDFEGVVTKVLGESNQALIRRRDTETTITVSLDLLRTTTPQKNDTIMIVSGPTNIGEIGKVFGIDNEECIVELRDTPIPLMINSMDCTVYQEVD